MLNSNFMHKLKSLFRASALKDDFSIYVLKLKKMAPLTFQSLGDEKLNQIFEAYFKELTINTENTEENIFYLPIFFKKYAEKFQISPYIIELSDYEFSCYQILQDPTPLKNAIFHDLTTEIFTNPISQALRLEHDIREFDNSVKNGKSQATAKPQEKRNLLIISKNLENSLVFVDGKTTHAAILDELHDGKMTKKDLINTLQTKYHEIPQRDWIVALKDLKSNFVVIET